jgi:hypothetical protein
MTFLDYFLKLSAVEKRELALICGTSVGYLDHVAHGRKRLSLGMALALVAASERALRAEDLPLADRAREQLALIRAAKRKPPEE